MMILHGLKSKILKVYFVNEYYAEIRKKSANQTKKIREITVQRKRYNVKSAI